MQEYGGRRLPRRTVLVGAAGAAVGAAAGPGVANAPAHAAAGRADGLRPVSMAMHVHGSFSEGIASYAAHLHQARRHTVDVIWWTDHDFRVAAHDYFTEVRFDGWSESSDAGLEWRWKAQHWGDVQVWTAFVASPRSPDEPGRAMRIIADGGPRGGMAWYRGVAWNHTYSVSMADTTLELDVHAKEHGPGRELILEIGASYHPATDGRPAGRYVLRYEMGGSEKVTRRTEGLRGIVTIPIRHRAWERIRVRPVADIAELWPDLVAEDNSLHKLRIGARAAPGERTRFIVDRLRIDRGLGDGASGVDLRRAVLDRYAEAYPEVAHYEAFEVSMVRHLNWIGGTLAVPELPSPPRRDNDPDKTESMIDFMHQHGALAQWCHPLDVTEPDALLRLLLRREALGADLIEIGRKPFDELRRVLDVAARNALFVTGVGASDDHDGRNWIDRTNNNLTYVWAASTSRADLVDALAAGRAWWLNPARWRGTLDMRLTFDPALVDRTALGGVLLTQAESVEVEVVATDLPRGGSLVIVEGRVDYAGTSDLTPATRSVDVPAADLDGRPYLHRVTVGEGRYVRLQVVDSSGDIVGESNPLWLLRAVPTDGVPEPRRLANRGSFSP